MRLLKTRIAQIIFGLLMSATISGATATEQSRGNVDKFFNQIERMRALPAFTEEAITKISGIPLEAHGVAMRGSNGPGTDTIDHMEVAFSREGKVTCVTVCLAKSLDITGKDIEKKFGNGTARDRKCEGFMTARYGYKKMVVRTYKKSGVTIEFHEAVAPKDRLHEVSLYR